MRVIRGPITTCYSKSWDEDPPSTVSEQNNATVGGSPGPTHQFNGKAVNFIQWEKSTGLGFLKHQQ